MTGKKPYPAVTLLAPDMVQQDYTVCGAVTVETVRQARKAVEALVPPATVIKLLIVCHGVRKFSYIPSEKISRPPHYATSRLVFLVSTEERHRVERFRAILPNDYESRVMDDRKAAIDWLNAWSGNGYEFGS